MTNTPNKGEEYVCCMCGETNTATVSHEEAAAEYKDNFSRPLDMADADIVCHDCYESMTAAKDPKEWTKEQEEKPNDS